MRNVLLASLTLLASCTAFRFEDQEVYLRHDAEEDVLEVGFVHEGVHASGSEAEDVEKCAAWLQKIAAGRRLFLVFDWPFTADLDDPEVRGEELEDPEIEALRLEWIEVLSRIHVDRAGLFTGEDGRLGAWQHFRIEGVGAAIALLNRAISAAVLESAPGPDDLGTMSAVDARTDQLWIERARAGGDWVRLEDGDLEVFVPVSKPGLARALSAILEESEKEQAFMRLLVGLSRPLSEIEFANEILVLRYRPGDSGWIEVRFEREEWDYDPRTLDRVLGTNTTIRRGATAAEIRELVLDE